MGSVRIAVFGASGCTPIPAASVTVRPAATSGSTGRAGFTDLLGNVAFEDLAPGKYAVEVESGGETARSSFYVDGDEWVIVPVALG